MTQRILVLAAALLLAAPAAAAAQAPTIAPGMTAEQVRAVFGAPAAVREAGGWAYWYYHNGCPRRCGSDDVVFIHEGRVVAAVLRTPRRRFTGPGASDALDRAQADAGPARVGGVRIETDEPPPPPEGEPRSSIIRVPGDGARGGARYAESDRGSMSIIITPGAGAARR